MRYYHDEPNEAVYAEPDEPMAVEKFESRTKRRTHPKYLGTTVWMAVEVMSAKNALDSSGHWVNSTSVPCRHQYDSRDSKAQAMEFFRQHYMGKWGTPISKEEYERLRATYEARARSIKVVVA